MNWNFLISFGVALAAYLVVVGVWALIKRHRNKKLADDDAKKFDDNGNKE